MKQFEELYNEIIINEELKVAWGEALAEKKKKQKKAISIFSVIIILIAIPLLVSSIKIEGFNLLTIPKVLFGMIPVMFFLGVIIFGISTLFSKKYRKYANIFKEIVIKKLIENFYNNVEYYPQKQMPKRIYDEEKYEYYNRYYSDDYIEAKINNKYDIGMAEIKTVEEETERDSDGTTRTKTTTKFHGIFAKIVIDKSINSELKIKQNGSFIFGKNKLEMDSSEFEKYFDVSATNKIIGMQLLTADVMEELINFINKTNMKYDIVIKNNNIYLRFHCGAMFEPQSLKKGIIDKKQIEKYFYMLNFTYNLSDKIIKTIQETQI
jgi:hypothetical protein